MAKINQVKLCPKCKSELLEEKPKECPVCGHSFEAPSSSFFGVPDYLYHQREHHLSSLIKEEYKKDQKAPTQEELKKGLQLEEDLAKFVRNLPYDDQYGAIFDARVIIGNILHSNRSGEELGRIIMLAKSVGKIAEAVDQYMKSGGTVYDRKVRFLQTNDGRDSWDQEATT